MKGKSVLLAVLWMIFAAIIASTGTCSFKSYSQNHAFDEVQIGDTEAAVIARFGEKPSFSEQSNTHFLRYATQQCSGECVRRLWYENRLSFDTEAWSVELDKHNRVIKKSRWVSP